MLRGCAKAVGRVVRGVAAAMGARPKVFAGVALGVFALDVFLPPLVLSLARKPWDYFAFNPWLARLPDYLASSEIPLWRKLEFLPNLALFWFSANGPFGRPEWGFAVDVSDLLRFLFMSLLFGAYFALWFYRRDRQIKWGPSARVSRHGGVVGALASVFGLSTGPCSVVGCGAPVLPVVGLAFAGLSSGALKFLSDLSLVAAGVLLIAMTLGVAYFAWLVGGRSTPAP
jgi:hypothetical protein